MSLPTGPEYFSHNITRALERAIDYLKDSPAIWTDARVEALMELQSKQLSLLKNFLPDNLDFIKDRYMERVFRSFDALLFPDDLSLFRPDRFTFKFAWIKQQDRGSTEVDGKTKSCDTDLDPTQPENQTIKGLIGVITHEISHAFTDGTFCSRSCRWGGCKDFRRRMGDQTGHGYLWMNLSRAVEVFLRLYLPRGVDTKRLQHMKLESAHSGLVPTGDCLCEMFDTDELPGAIGWRWLQGTRDWQRTGAVGVSASVRRKRRHQKALKMWKGSAVVNVS